MTKGAIIIKRNIAGFGLQNEPMRQTPVAHSSLYVQLLNGHLGKGKIALSMHH